MRIRKHAKLAGLSLTATAPSGGCSADPTVPHGCSSSSSYRFHCPPHPICQLNQSPWDLLSFPSPDSPSSPFQVDGEVGSNYTANGSSANSLGAVESVASMRIPMDMEDKYVNRSNKLGFGNGGTISCCKTFAEGFECKTETSKGHSHQLIAHDSLTAAHTSTAAKKLEKPLAAAPIRRRRGRPRKVQAPPPPPPPPAVVNPYEFYYYSGFGPRRGRKRSGSHLAKSKSVEEEDEEEEEINLLGRVPDCSSVLLSSSEMDSDEFDYVHEEDEEEGKNAGAKKKKVIRRGRKPIKARSLKSLISCE